MRVYWKDIVAKVLVYSFIPLVASSVTILVRKVIQMKERE